MHRAFLRAFRSADRSPLDPSCFPRGARADFYREELLKHQRCLEQQREYFSEQAIHGVEHALETILARLDTLCRHKDCEAVMSALLKKFDLVTRLSAWDDHGRSH
jgi:hypothetical protein